MKDKFSIRHLAFSLVPLKEEGEAAGAIAKAAQQHDLSDGQMLELIRQINVANQYHAFKKANFQVSVDSIDVPTLDPGDVFKRLNKVAAFESLKTFPKKFTELKNKGGVKKAASLQMPKVLENKYATFIKEMVKQADLDSDDAKVACLKIKRELAIEENQVKKAFLSTVKDLEKQIEPFAYFRKKYAHLIGTPVVNDPGESVRSPKASHLVQVNATIEKLGQLTEEYSQIKSMLHILERR